MQHSGFLSSSCYEDACDRQWRVEISAETVWSRDPIVGSRVSLAERERDAEPLSRAQNRRNRHSDGHGERGSRRGHSIHLLAAVCLLFCVCTAVCSLILCMHGAGLTKEADCALCAPGKYQTGVGLTAEANCTACVAGKYQSGSGVNAAFWLSLLLLLRRCL